jgi:hypothetical protein
MLGAAISVTAILAYKRIGSRNHFFDVVAGAVPILAAIILLPALTPTVVTHPGWNPISSLLTSRRSSSVRQGFGR